MIREYIIKVDDTKTDIMGGTPLEEPPKELVRCKDCRFYKQSKHGKGYCIGSCDVLGYVDGDWFCGDGKPKEGDGDG